jgi:hypothetical protein
MPTLADLGRLYKEEHPDEYDLSDEEVGRMVKSRYPHDPFYQTFKDTQLARYETRSLTTQISDPNHDTKLFTLWNSYRSDMGGFWAWFKGKSQDRRNDFLEKVGKNQKLLIEQAEDISTAIINRQRSESDLRRFIAENESVIQNVIAYAQLYHNAAQQGLTVEGFDRVNQEYYLSEIRKQEAEFMNKLHIMTLEAEKRLEMEERSRIVDDEIRKINAELDARIREYEARVNAGIVSDYLKNNRKVLLIQEFIDEQHTQIMLISQNRYLDHNTKQQMIADRREIINEFKRQRTEASRLL